MSRETTIFLASSAELKAEREALSARIGELTERWHAEGVFLRLARWERFDSAVAATRKRDQCNQEIEKADIFLMLVHTHVGTYALEEFETAVRCFQSTGRPRIYTYFKHPPHPNDRNTPPEYDTVRALLKRLQTLEHFPDAYREVPDLLLSFGDNLEALRQEGYIAAGLIGDASSPTLHGSGGMAIGSGALAGGERSVVVQGGIHGNVFTGAGDQVSGDKIVTIHQMADSHAQNEAARHRQQIDSYLRRLADTVDKLPASAQSSNVDMSRTQALRLSDVYVALNTTATRRKSQTLAQALLPPRQASQAARRRGAESADEAEDRRTAKEANVPVSALEALAHHHQLTLLGSAGSGKSSFGAHVLASLARAGLARSDGKSELGEAWPHGPLLPLRVVLRAFAEQHAQTVGDLTARHLWQHIAETEMAGTTFTDADQAREQLQTAAHERGAWVLFDGLDECGPAERQQRVLQAVQRFVDDFGTGLRTLTTARPYAFPQGASPHDGCYEIAELDDEQVERFVHGWYVAAQQHGWPMRDNASPESLTAELVAARSREDLRKLTANPLLLTLTTTLHLRDRLPDDRADLYEQSVQLLLERWNVAIGADKALIDELKLPDLRRIGDLRPVLEQVAFEVHERNQGEAATADVAESHLLHAFKEGLTGSFDKACQVVEYIERRAGLLMGQGLRQDTRRTAERQFRFPHRTFQEYLAACHLARMEPDEMAAECERLARANPGHWQLVLPLSARKARPLDGANAADHMVGSQDVEHAAATAPINAEQWRMALLAGMMLAEMRPVDLRAPGRQRIRDRIRTWLLRSLPVHPGDGGMQASERALAGDLLNQLGGDPRFDPAFLYLPRDELRGFVHIEADAEFSIGTRKADRKKVEAAIGWTPAADEINSSRTPTDAFYIARYPITVAQFRAYLDDARRQPGDVNVLRDPANRPVRYVSWDEARAYCEWLQQKLQSIPEAEAGALTPLIRQGWQVALPTELQWEKAARGARRNRVFSWGDEPDAERANCGESLVNDTSAVGCFPAAEKGLHDLLGNVWEWTASLFDAADNDEDATYPQCVQDPRFDAWAQKTENVRVVRGGSWNDHRDNARCAFRGRLHPGDRNYYLGFRVVLRSSPVSRPPVRRKR